MRTQEIQSGYALTALTPADPTPSPKRYTSGTLRNSMSENRGIAEA